MKNWLMRWGPYVGSAAAICTVLTFVLGGELFPKVITSVRSSLSRDSASIMLSAQEDKDATTIRVDNQGRTARASGIRLEITGIRGDEGKGYSGRYIQVRDILPGGAEVVQIEPGLDKCKVRIVVRWCDNAGPHETASYQLATLLQGKTVARAQE